MELASWFKSRCVEAVYSSPLSRCMETAEYIAGERQRVHVEEGLVELDAGEWENMESLKSAAGTRSSMKRGDVPSARSRLREGNPLPGAQSGFRMP